MLLGESSQNSGVWYRLPSQWLLYWTAGSGHREDSEHVDRVVHLMRASGDSELLNMRRGLLKGLRDTKYIII